MIVLGLATCDAPGIPGDRTAPYPIQCTAVEQGRRWICHCPGRHIFVADDALTGVANTPVTPGEFEDTGLGGALVECADDDPDTFTIIEPPTDPADADGIRYMTCFDE